MLINETEFSKMGGYKINMQQLLYIKSPAERYESQESIYNSNKRPDALQQTCKIYLKKIKFRWQHRTKMAF